MKKVVVFGTFDALHDGHRFFLDFARKQGDILIASVADDAVVERAKHRAPRHKTSERMRHLEDARLVDKTMHGDSELGAWTVLHAEEPDILVVGYDQDALMAALTEIKEVMGMPFLIVQAPAFEGDRLHSSLLRENESGLQ